MHPTKFAFPKVFELKNRLGNKRIPHKVSVRQQKTGTQSKKQLVNTIENHVQKNIRCKRLATRLLRLTIIGKKRIRLITYNVQAWVNPKPTNNQSALYLYIHGKKLNPSKQVVLEF